MGWEILGSGGLFKHANGEHGEGSLDKSSLDKGEHITGYYDGDCGGRLAEDTKLRIQIVTRF